MILCGFWFLGYGLIASQSSCLIKWKYRHVKYKVWHHMCFRSRDSLIPRDIVTLRTTSLILDGTWVKSIWSWPDLFDVVLLLPEIYIIGNGRFEWELWHSQFSGVFYNGKFYDFKICMDNFNLFIRNYRQRTLLRYSKNVVRYSAYGKGQRHLDINCANEVMIDWVSYQSSNHEVFISTHANTLNTR